LLQEGEQIFTATLTLPNEESHHSA
jgi:hypothetical protein